MVGQEQENSKSALSFVLEIEVDYMHILDTLLECFKNRYAQTYRGKKSILSIRDPCFYTLQVLVLNQLFYGQKPFTEC